MRDPTSQPPTRPCHQVASRAFFRVKSHRDLHSRVKPPLSLHHILICVHIRFSFYSYYTTQSVKSFLGSKQI
jgi:hypothetical protein